MLKFSQSFFPFLSCHYGFTNYFEILNFLVSNIKPGGVLVLDKSHPCVRDVLEIIRFLNHRTWLFFNKYAHEHNFWVS